MKRYKRFPLYLGLGVFIITVMVSAVKLGEKSSITEQRSLATTAGAILTMRFTAPDLISISVGSDKEIAGVDVALRFDNSKITIIPSSLSAGPSFAATGGVFDDNGDVFSFSAMSKSETVKSAVVAGFMIRPRMTGENVSADMQPVTEDNKTAVIDKVTGENILKQAEGVKFELPAQ
jgi:hypothetical protein